MPIIDYTVPAPAESQYDTINIVGQYDIFSDPPNRPGNLLADLNAIAAGGYYGHSATAFSDPARVAPRDITTTTNSLGATTTTYFIRTDQLPLVRALVDMAGLPPQAAGTVDAALRPIIDRAYQPGPAPAVNPRDLVQGIRGIPAIAPAIAIPIGSTTGASAATSTAAATAAATNALRGATWARAPARRCRWSGVCYPKGRSTSHKVHDLRWRFAVGGVKGVEVFDDGGCCWPTNPLLLTPIHREGPGWRLGAPGGAARWRPSSSVN